MLKRLFANACCLLIRDPEKRHQFRKNIIEKPTPLPGGVRVDILRLDAKGVELSRKQVNSYPGLLVVCRESKGNRIEIEESDFPMTLKLIFSEGDNHFVAVGAPRLISQNTIHIFAMLRRDNALLTIGRGLQGAKLTATLVGGKISIGEDCLLSLGPVGVDVRNSDLHSILDVKSRSVLNKTRDVEIGDHVWLADGVSVLKGAKISGDCVVAAHAVVTGSSRCSPSSLLAGIPATVVRTGITWDGAMPEDYKLEVRQSPQA